MVRRIGFVGILVAALLVSVLVLPASEKPVVMVGIPPLKWVVESIVGDRAEVGVFLRPGQTPHTSEPVARQVAELNRASAFLYIGLEVERAVAKRAVAQNPSLRCYDVGGLLHEGAASVAHPHVSGCMHDQEYGDPHVWLAPALLEGVAERCAAALHEALPAAGKEIEAGLARTRVRIRATDADVRAILQPVLGCTMLVYHPSWNHFVAAYGLRQLAVEADGRAPSAKHLAAVITQVKREKVRTLFSNPDAPEAVVRRVAAALGCRLEVIDPLAAAWDTNLLDVARRIAAGIAPEGTP